WLEIPVPYALANASFAAHRPATNSTCRFSLSILVYVFNSFFVSNLPTNRELLAIASLIRTVSTKSVPKPIIMGPLPIINYDIIYIYFNVFTSKLHLCDKQKNRQMKLFNLTYLFDWVE